MRTSCRWTWTMTEHLDRVIIHAPMGLGSDAQRAVRTLGTDGRREEWGTFVLPWLVRASSIISGLCRSRLEDTRPNCSDRRLEPRCGRASLRWSFPGIRSVAGRTRLRDKCLQSSSHEGCRPREWRCNAERADATSQARRSGEDATGCSPASRRRTYAHADFRRAPFEGPFLWATALTSVSACSKP